VRKKQHFLKLLLIIMNFYECPLGAVLNAAQKYFIATQQIPLLFWLVGYTLTM
jgi:hypothetical protein